MNQTFFKYDSYLSMNQNLFWTKNHTLKVRFISPYGDAILKKLKLSVIACKNYFQLICLLKDL
jgi:hypothetical protein